MTKIPFRNVEIWIETTYLIQQWHLLRFSLTDIDSKSFLNVARYLASYLKIFIVV